MAELHRLENIYWILVFLNFWFQFLSKLNRHVPSIASLNLNLKKYIFAPIVDEKATRVVLKVRLLVPTGYQAPPESLLQAAGPPGARARPTSTAAARASTASIRASLFSMPAATTEVSWMEGLLSSLSPPDTLCLKKPELVEVSAGQGRLSLHSESQPLGGTTDSGRRRYREARSCLWAACWLISTFLFHVSCDGYHQEEVWTVFRSHLRDGRRGKLSFCSTERDEVDVCFTVLSVSQRPRVRVSVYSTQKRLLPCMWLFY